MILQINRLFIVQKTNKFEHKPKGYILLYKKLLKKKAMVKPFSIAFW